MALSKYKKEFINTLLLGLTFIYVFGFFGFYFFRDTFYDDDDNRGKSDNLIQKDELCTSLA